MRDRPEIGVYLREAAPQIAVLKQLFVESHTLIDPEVALPRRDRVTVYLTNHGPMVSPFPAPALTVEYLLAQGGYDDLVAVTLFHRLVEFIPGLSPVLTRYFGHSTRELRSLAGLVALMKARRIQILGTVPEGRSCMWSFDAPVGPFTKHGLMIAALEAGADIVLAAQHGVERFGQPVRLPAGLTLPIPGRPRGVQIPLWYPGRRAHITVGYGRYRPLISPEDRARLDRPARRAQLQDEFAAIHRQLSDLYRSLPTAPSPPR
jgi:hypothetical protein